MHSVILAYLNLIYNEIESKFRVIQLHDNFDFFSKPVLVGVSVFAWVFLRISVDFPMLATFLLNQKTNRISKSSNRLQNSPMKTVMIAMKRKPVAARVAPSSSRAMDLGRKQSHEIK